jgi:uncharacterized membrane protein
MLGFGLKKYLSEAGIKLVTAKIAEAEKQTTGEIRIAIRHRRQLGEGKLGLHELALKEFARLGMQKTNERTGVLIFLLLSERKFQIIADEGIHAKVADGTWDRIAASMGEYFKAGDFARGLCDAVDAVGGELKQYFPGRPDDTDELSNDIIET